VTDNERDAQKINWDEWKAVNEEKVEYQEVYEKELTKWH